METILEWIKSKLEFLVKPSIPSLIVIFACISLIFASPFDLRGVLRLDSFYEQHRPWMAFLLLYSGIFLLYYTVLASWTKIKNTYTEKQNKKELKQKIQLLTLQEKSLLKYFAEQKSAALWIPCDYLPMLTLMQKGFLVSLAGASDLRGNRYDRRQCFPCMINKIVSDLLGEHPSLLSAPPLDPDYAKQIESVQSR